MHFDLLLTKSFHDLKIVFETLLYKYSIRDVAFIADQKMSFQKTRHLITEKKALSFYDSRYAGEFKKNW